MVMAGIGETRARGYNAMMLTGGAIVKKRPTHTSSILKGGKFSSPPIPAGALRGITRSVVFEIAAETGIKVSETDITRHDVFIADECFLTGTAAEIIPVVKADGRPIGTGKPGPITARMVARFREMKRETGTPTYSSDRH